jgi:hypothetical protein
LGRPYRIMRKKISIAIVWILIVSSFVSVFSIECVLAAPETPSDPKPENGSINVSVTANLSWTGDNSSGGAVKYDVYFGTTSPPLKIDSNQSGISYDPGTMNYQTTYYWKIIAWDGYGESSAGPIWNFTTIEESNNPPFIPSYPSPPDELIDVNITVDLSWTGEDPDGDTVNYDVFFGTSSPPPKIISNQSATAYDPGTLGYSTTYNWKIIPWDSHGASTEGLTWQFTTIDEPNNPPYIPNEPSPGNNATAVDIHDNLSWTGGDPDAGDTVGYDVYFGLTSAPLKVASNQTGSSYQPALLNGNTTYYWMIVAWDNHDDSTAGPLWNFTTDVQQNQPPNDPGSPSPSNGATGVSVNADLSWTGGDPDGDAVTYDVYFGSSSPPPILVGNQLGLSYDPGTLGFNTIYYWRIISWDNHSLNTTSQIWLFTTTGADGGGGGGGGGGEPPVVPENNKPVSNASAGEPYRGFVNSEILFDGSRSYDPDGNITKWSWVFGDNINGTGKTAPHVYSKAGTYTVNLTVTDDDGATNTDTTTCVITRPNRPPTKPVIQGTKSGPKNTIYTYTAVSTDADNDTIQYTFDWGDAIVQSSGFLRNGTSFTANHSWAAAGRYSVTVTVTDNQTESSSNLIVSIDALQINGVGYLLDNDSDGIYDAFYSDVLKQITTIQKKDSNYNIDSDGDGDWDYTFDATRGRTIPYQGLSKAPGFEIIVIIGAIALVMFWKQKRRNRN